MRCGKNLRPFRPLDRVGKAGGHSITKFCPPMRFHTGHCALSDYGYCRYSQDSIRTWRVRRGPSRDRLSANMEPVRSTRTKDGSPLALRTKEVMAREHIGHFKPSSG